MKVMPRRLARAVDLLVENGDEQDVNAVTMAIYHLLGETHFGPTCPVCGVNGTSTDKPEPKRPAWAVES